MTERVASVELPVGIRRPQLGPVSTGLGEVLHYIVWTKNPSRTLEELRTIHDWVIKPELRKVPGVAEVNSWGGLERQFHVVVSPAALLEYKLTLDFLHERVPEQHKPYFERLRPGEKIYAPFGDAELKRFWKDWSAR